VRQESRSFGTGTQTVPEARRFARNVLTSWNRGGCEWILLQLVSELVTNAVIHARTQYVVTIKDDGETLLVEVADHSPRPATPRQYDGTATTGRGLRLVDRLSQSWGSEVAADGKTVWARVDASPGGDTADADIDALLDTFDDDVPHPVPIVPDSKGTSMSLGGDWSWDERAA